ncbi:Alpha,alpha-trehalose-phosphate synthase [Schizosaccharomyces pombe]|uniref:Putative alpha,alpha-trehalose-phosphate synthase [UDP-forming] 100 kDa subunit n=1 Tax=Schizosaccharomyces pombe (strain 972 / ATCC 24843) TaxID=284812 RepID=TPSY_SCHPO|nr:putative alpha,alpha-trehalose-phosphate synthase [Schizosaccharomyces pombe]Q9UUI7.1 RecName: Full=Putative alpha,alpha-trehalose-phosphate synthase [UDP-forming] 100 kDa subunit; AltName: Full=Trehalose-6-phosphate synthase; AltName: Full=UDP-glucose-glucosephosphate glucosyltransferase [Schizosaccharomyces pombe 972h-]CAB52715.1 alpha,alpha-trehalose-phosphate synthase (predicted) [Schizosaccharomyces pombe]|eukprot:NP_594728.1 putative alpha,alpha-trehalose-phosphate synthase [Schizosaccharomyces pombe]
MGRQFICSIYLPYTINFHLDELEGNHESHPAITHQEKVTQTHRDSVKIDDILTRLSISKSESGQATPVLTPQLEGMNDYFSLGPSKRTGGSMTPGLGAMSPIPGSGRSSPLYTQPRSRATSPSRVRQADRFAAPGIGAGALPIRRKRRDSLAKSVALFESARWSVERGVVGNSGLFHAVDAAVRDHGLQNPLWVGLLGMPTESLSEKTKNAISGALLVKHQSLVVYTSDSNFEGHYNHYCRKILWPSLHYQHNEIFSFFHEESNWDDYVAVNRAFADALIKNYKTGDTIWVNDYHLLLVPNMVRERIPSAIIGLFIHVSFPSSEVFRCFARRKELLQGMLGSNLIGFQTEEYKRHFLQSCSRVLYAESTFDRILLDDRYIDVYAHPIGADPVLVDKWLENPETLEVKEVLEKRYANLNIFVGCDKMDPIRGIREKLLAFEQFLYDNPEYQKNTILIQTSTFTEEQKEYGVAISDIVTRINSAFGDFSLDHLPVTILSSDLSYPQYLALLSVADAFIVTSLREGMSLTCHEFILTQRQKKSPLIVSEFIGCASMFSNGAFIVNPWSTLELSLSMKKALTLSTNERNQRYSNCLDVVLTHSASNWVTGFETKLKKSWTSQQKRDFSRLPRFTLNFIGNRYDHAKKRLLILNFDGNAVTWEGRHEFVDFHYGYMVSILSKLIADDRNIVYIASCLEEDELESLFMHVPGVGLIAENGCYVLPHYAENVHQSWIRLYKKQQMDWREPLHDIIQYYSERTPGSSLIDHGFAMEFNYVKAENRENGLRSAGELASSINETQHGCRAVPLDGRVLCEPTTISKATAANYIMTHLIKNPEELDLILVAGNNRTDESVFAWANKSKVSSFTVSMGVGNTEAKAYTDGIPSFFNVLNSLCA